MKTLFGHAGKTKNNSPMVATYNVGLLQTKAHKAIMGKTSALLSTIGLSNTEWVNLGIIHDNPNGIRPLVLAETLDVEQPFVTVMNRKLKKMGLITISVDSSDKRAKIIHITAKGQTLVKKTEQMLDKEMTKISMGISVPDSRIYLKVLKSIVDYFDKQK